MWRALNGVFVAAFLIGHGSIEGQNPSTPRQATAFTASVEVVALNVSATDGARRYVTDLGPNDFNVFEDGHQQEVTFFRKTGVPLALALLLDTSASMDQALAVAQEAAIGFARQIEPVDVASVIDFDSRVQIRQDFTNDRKVLEHAIRATSAGGMTALYNALYIALKELIKPQPRSDQSAELRRRAIVVLSDGEDTSSLVTFDEVLDLAAHGDTAIYAIGLLPREATAARRPQDAAFVLRRLAQQTGGRAFFPTAVKDLPAIYGEIKAELSSQYALAYESNNLRRDGQFRRIAIRVERTGVVARTRPGYYAPAK
jgi:Ca-activated chloride channel family protein